MEHPPKQGLKLEILDMLQKKGGVLMEHPPKQGLKPNHASTIFGCKPRFNGTSTKTRIETGEEYVCT